MKLSLKMVATSVLLLAVVIATPLAAGATTTSTSTATTTISTLQALWQQIKSLQEQLVNLLKKQTELRSEIREQVRLARELQQGMTGEEVKLLQELLATDPTIYPEGIRSGYFGPLTFNAVKKFQKKFGLIEDGKVSSSTLSRINEILKEGAGNSGKVPPGLLIAPGILKKLGYVPAPLPGQKLPPGIAKKLNMDDDDDDDSDENEDSDDDDEEENEGPEIDDLEATNVSSTTATISWETDEDTKSVLWYGTSSPLTDGNSSKMEDDDYEEEHSFNLTGLEPDETYYYKVFAENEDGEVATSSQESFETDED